MLSNKKKNKRSRRILEEAAIYSEDIGTLGIKKTAGGASSYQKPISSLPLPEDEDKRRLQRMERFSGVTNGEPTAMSTSLSSGRTHEKVPGKKRKKVTKHANFVGTSAVLEKAYLRLTDYPKPENVRPLPILIKALAHIKSHYIRHEDFDWANEQLKSVRQDLTVQHIRNNFSLNVYETHARILIEHGDLDEFHQCQCMIQALTSPTRLLDPSSEGTDELGGDFHLGRSRQGDESVKQSEEAVDEFYAYGLLYHLAQKSWGELTHVLASLHRANGENDSDSPISSLHLEDIPSHSSGVSVRHALKVVLAVMHVDYYNFFRLYESAPHLSAYLMDFLVRRVRKNAFERIVASYRPSLSVEHFRVALSFEDLEETRQFLRENGAMFIHELGAPPFWVDCKATAQAIPRPVSSDGRILS